MFGSMLLNRSRTTGTMLTGDTMLMWGDLRVNGVAQTTAPIVLDGNLSIPGVSSGLVLSGQNSSISKNLTTTCNGSLSISQKGGSDFQAGSNCTLRVTNAGVMTLGRKPPFGPDIGTVRISNRFTQAKTGIPDLPTHYEYQTFRTEGFVSDHSQAFVRVIIQPSSM